MPRVPATKAPWTYQGMRGEKIEPDAAIVADSTAGWRRACLKRSRYVDDPRMIDR